MKIEEIQSQIQYADSLLQQKRDLEAKAVFENILTLNLPEANSISYFRLGEIANRQGELIDSERFHRLAFENNAALCAQLLPANISHRNYVYHRGQQMEIIDCPLCSSPAVDHSVYNIALSANFIDGFDPIRLWKQCENSLCSHIFSSNIPKNLSQILSETSSSVIQDAKIHRLPQIAEVLSNLSKSRSLTTCLEVGAGAGEQVAVALEFGFEVEAVEIRESYCKNLRETFTIPVYNQSIEEIVFEKKYDLILMGDVLEHVIDPVKLLMSLKETLTPLGVIWVSTPNFESAMTRLTKTYDPMWQVCEHLQYFSKKSLGFTLAKIGLQLVEYKSSFQYNGSMELIITR
ncbi:class I SAM-dependent methyltransferase [bacterium]|nr:class I SAM-dependent methyltransferase [bacterium]